MTGFLDSLSFDGLAVPGQGYPPQYAAAVAHSQQPTPEEVLALQAIRSQARSWVQNFN